MPIPIVGTRHHPTAVALMAILPHGAAVCLIPEPENRYDPNAIAIRLPRETLKRVSAQAVQQALAPHGYSTQAILDREWWHLGYIPAKWPRDNLTLPAEGTLCFTSRGAPQVEGV